MFTLKVYTGPSLTRAMIEKCQEAGLGTLLRGTEHIYPTVDASGRREASQRFLDLLKDRHGTDFGLGGGLSQIRVMPLWPPT